MSRRECFFFGDSALLLDKMKRDADGIVSGHVVNGNWRAVIATQAPNQGITVHGHFIKTKITGRILIPDDLPGDYNEVIEWARVRL